MKNRDEYIIELYFLRDERAVTEPQREYGSFWMDLALRILGRNNREDAEECVNDTYLKAWNAIPPTGPRSLRAFLSKIVRNLSLQRLEHNTAAKRNRDFEIALEELGDCIPAPEERDATELLGHIKDFLREQDETDRNLFVGRYFHAYEVQRMAEGYGLTPNAVSLRLYKTREKLRVYLQERGYSV